MLSLLYSVFELWVFYEFFLERNSLYTHSVPVKWIFLCKILFCDFLLYNITFHCVSILIDIILFVIINYIILRNYLIFLRLIQNVTSINIMGNIFTCFSGILYLFDNIELLLKIVLCGLTDLEIINFQVYIHLSYIPSIDSSFKWSVVYKIINYKLIILS